MTLIFDRDSKGNQGNVGAALFGFSDINSPDRGTLTNGSPIARIDNLPDATGAFNGIVMASIVYGAAEHVKGSIPPVSSSGIPDSPNSYDISCLAQLGGSPAHQSIISHSFVRQWSTLYHMDNPHINDINSLYNADGSLSGRLIVHLTNKNGVPQPTASKWVWLSCDGGGQTGGINGAQSHYVGLGINITVYISNNGGTQAVAQIAGTFDSALGWTGEDPKTGQYGLSGTVPAQGSGVNISAGVDNLAGFYVRDGDVVLYTVTFGEQIATEVMGGSPTTIPVSNAQSRWTMSLK